MCFLKKSMHRFKFTSKLCLLQAFTKMNGTNGKICAKVAFPRYTESVKFKSQSRETASKRKPYRGLGWALGSHPRDNGHVTH